MITKAGIVGPKNTVEMVLEISEEYKEKLRIFPFIYLSLAKFLSCSILSIDLSS